MPTASLAEQVLPGAGTRKGRLSGNPVKCVF